MFAFLSVRFFAFVVDFVKRVCRKKKEKKERKMFWRDRERDSKELNGGPPCGQVRVAVVGDSGTMILSLFPCSL